MQFRVCTATGLSLALALTTGCGKSGGGGNSPEKPKKPTLSTPGLPVTESTTEPSKPEAPGPSTTPDSPVKPGETPKPNETKEPVKPVVTEKFPHAVKGLWGFAIAQKPRACSSFYDLRDPLTLSIHLLCPGENGRNIALQTESFTRLTDDGNRASFRRVASTCGLSPTVPGTIFLTYKKDANGRLQLNEGSKASPLLDGIDPANLAGDLKAAVSLHGRPLVRGCFRSGNLQIFDAAKG